MSIYLDYNASTPINQQVLNKMISVYQNNYGNPDSRTHDFGQNSLMLLNNARSQVASLLGITPSEVIFTSGATESNNTILQGLRTYGLTHKKKHIITSTIEHKAILEVVKHLRENDGFDIDYIKPNLTGRINADEVISKIRKDTLLVTIMHANNETGVIQPVKEIGDFVSTTDAFFHIDATQSCGKLVEEIKALKYDALSLSAHKFYGPQGIGALILRKKNYRRIPVKPILFGGGQEFGIRPGTTPVALAVGLGEASRLAENNYKTNYSKMLKTQQTLLALLNDSKIEYLINGTLKNIMPNTLNICFKGIPSEALMLSSKQFCSVSNGSACTSHDYRPSYVLTSMGLPVEQIESSIRMSWGCIDDNNDLELSFNELLNAAKKLAF